MRGREEIARLTARLRSEHDEYECSSLSWSPEAGEKKKELRKARADTWVEIGAALTWLGEVERFREIERLPFEQKLGQLDAFLDDTPREVSAAPSREENTPPDATAHDLEGVEAFLEDAPNESAAPSLRGNTLPAPDAILLAIAEPSIARPEPVATSEAPRATSEPTRLASLPPRSMRPRPRRSMGYWPMRVAPPAMPRAATSRVPLLVGVIAVQGLALAVLAVALLRVTPRSAESERSLAATGNAAATALAAPLPPATPPVASGIPDGLPVAVPADDPGPPAAAAETPRRAVSPPRSKPTAVPSPPELARRPEIFNPDTL